MKYNLHCQNLELSDLERDALDKKMERLERHLEPPFTVDINLQHDAHHLKGNVISCRINIEHGRKVFHADRIGDTIADTIDQVVDALKRELERDHSRRKDKHM